MISGDNFCVVTLQLEYPQKTTHEIVVGEIKGFPKDEKLKKEADIMVKNFLMGKHPNLYKPFKKVDIKGFSDIFL